MKPKLTTRFVFVVSMLVAASVFAADGVPADDGLVPIKIKNVDLAYKRPGAELRDYNKLMIRPVSVAFSKNWNPRNYGTFGLTSDEVKKIRDSLATMTEETFRNTLSGGGYELVPTAGENVLDVEANIVDLFINAPDASSAGSSRSYVMNAGEMRMVLTLRDSVTGTVLYRMVDRKRGADAGRLQWASSVWNRAEAQRALTAWARQLKSGLDSARAP